MFCCGARAILSSMLRQRTRELTHAQLVDMMSKERHAQKIALWLTQKCYLLRKVACRELTEQNSARGGKISIVQSIQLSFLRSLGSTTSNELIRAQCCVQSGQQNAIQVQAIKTGHISKIYRQTGDILSVSSKGTAAAK